MTQFLKLTPIIIAVLATPAFASPIVLDLKPPKGISPIATKKPNTHSDLDAFVQQTASQYGINPLLIWAIVQTESNYQATARSPKGALGLMQVMPSTAAQYGNYNLLDPKQNITVGTRHFAYLLKRYKNQIHLALAAYNAGEGNVDKYGGIPPFNETKRYVYNIITLYSDWLEKSQNTPMPAPKHAPNDSPKPLIISLS